MKVTAEGQSDIEDINSRLECMANRARILGIVFSIAFWLLVLVAIVFMVASIIGGVNESAVPEELAIGLMLFICSAVLGCLLLRVVADGFKDVAKAGSPFTTAQANRLVILGVLFLLYAAFEAVVSLSPYYGSIGIASANYVASPHLFLDAKYVFASIFCFCLSYVFRYGALLQWLQDETL